MKRTVLVLLCSMIMGFPVFALAAGLRSDSQTGTTPERDYSPCSSMRESLRELLPPADLTATVTDQINVQLNWSVPTDLIHIYYHDGNPANAYYQSFERAYGTVFDLSLYPNSSLEYLAFRHSPWGLNGEWDYSILMIDWEAGTLLQRIDNLTTAVNNGWETEIPLNSVSGSSLTGVFIIPLGNDINDAYPVLDIDNEMNGDSYVIYADDYSIDTISTGDFLMDLWIRDEEGRFVKNPAETGESVSEKPKSGSNSRQELTGYKVYRNGDEIHHISDPEAVSYLDENLSDGSYIYHVTAIYDEGESEPSNTAAVTINTGIQLIWSDNFDSYPDFALEFEPWEVLDIDGGPTYGFPHVSFPGEYQPMGFIILNPSATTPPLSDFPVPSGSKVAASFASSNQQSNNWLISKKIELGSDSSLLFQARSYSTEHGNDRFRVGISTTDRNPESFSFISQGDYVEAPGTWTEFSYDLSQYNNQGIYIGVNSVSDDSWVLLIDDFRVYSAGVSVTEDHMTEPLTSVKPRNFPNPFNPETTIEFTLAADGVTRIEVFDIRGRKVSLLFNDYLPTGTHRISWSGLDNRQREAVSGIYFYRITTDHDTQTGKMILLK